MSCLKDLKISEIKKLNLVYYVHFGFSVGNCKGKPHIMKIDCMKRKKDFYKDFWLGLFLSAEEFNCFTTLKEAEDCLLLIKKKE